MKTRKIIVSLFFVLLSAAHSTAVSQTTDSIKYSFYQIKADRVDINSVNSFPQKIVKIVSNQAPFVLEIQTHNSNLPAKRFDTIKTIKYCKTTNIQKDIKIYLEPTELIECKSPKISCIVDSLAKDVVYTYDLIFAILKYVSATVKYDNDLAKKISAGENNTRSALETLDMKMGTCSEYTNLFLACIRNAGIPGKFVVGRILLPDGNQTYHAWAECHIEDIGWMPVEVQNGNTWIPDWGIKLFSGKDFNDCNITLPEIHANIERVSE